MKLTIFALLCAAAFGCTSVSNRSPETPTTAETKRSAAPGAKHEREAPLTPILHLVTRDAGVEPAFLGERTIFHNRLDGTALAEFRDGALNVDASLALPRANCWSASSWEFFGSFPNAAYAIAGIEPGTPRTRGHLMHWRDNAWTPTKELVAHRVLGVTVAGHPLILRDQVNTTPPGDAYRFDYLEGVGDRGIPFVARPAAMVATGARVLIVGTDADGFARADLEHFRSERLATESSSRVFRDAPGIVLGIAANSVDLVWVALQDESQLTRLVRYAGDGQWTTEHTLEQPTLSLALSTSGELWLVKAKGHDETELLRRDTKGQLHVVPLRAALGHPRRVWVGRDDTLWLATSTGLYTTAMVTRPTVWNSGVCPPDPPPTLTKLFEQPCVDPVEDAPTRHESTPGEDRVETTEPLTFTDFDGDGVKDTQVKLRVGSEGRATALYHYHRGCSRYLGTLSGVLAVPGVYDEFEAQPKSNGLYDLTISDGCSTHCCESVGFTVYRFDGLRYRELRRGKRRRACVE